MLSGDDVRTQQDALREFVYACPLLRIATAEQAPLRELPLRTEGERAMEHTPLAKLGNDLPLATMPIEAICPNK